MIDIKSCLSIVMQETTSTQSLQHKKWMIQSDLIVHVWKKPYLTQNCDFILGSSIYCYPFGEPRFVIRFPSSSAMYLKRYLLINYAGYSCYTICNLIKENIVVLEKSRLFSMGVDISKLHVC